MKLGPIEITYKSSGRFSCTLNSLVRNPAYVLCVILVIQPINGALIALGNPLLGFCLILTQSMWAYDIAKDAFKDKDS